MDTQNQQALDAHVRRQTFAKKTIGWFFLFLVVSWAQIFPFLVIETTRSFLRRHIWIIIIAITFQICATFSLFCVPAFSKHPLDKLWAAIMVEICVLGALPWCVHFEVTNVGISIGIAIGCFFGAVVVALLCRVPTLEKFLLLVIVMRTFSCLIGTGFLIAYIVSRLYFLCVVGCSLIISTMFVELVLVSQLLFGGVIASEEPDMVVVTAVMIYYTDMNLAYFILPLLEEPFGRKEEIF